MEAGGLGVQRGSSWGQPYDPKQPWTGFYHFTFLAPESLAAVLPGFSSSLPAPAGFHCFPYHSHLCVLLSAFTSFLPVFIKPLLYTENSIGDPR